MKYNIRSYFPDELGQDPGIDVEVTNHYHVVRDYELDISDCMVNDYGDPFPVGNQVIITRIE